MCVGLTMGWNERERGDQICTIRNGEVLSMCVVEWNVSERRRRSHVTDTLKLYHTVYTQTVYTQVFTTEVRQGRFLHFEVFTF